MERRSRILVALGTSFLAAFLLVALLTSAAGAASAANATNGKALFDKNCASCHGANAAGGVKVGGATAPDLRWSRIGPAGKNYRGNESLIQRAILSGKDEDGGDLDAAMPRWQGKLTDPTVSDIIAYLKTTGAASVAATSAPKQATPAVLPKTGSPIGTQSLPWIAGIAVFIVAAGFGVKRWALTPRK